MSTSESTLDQVKSIVVKTLGIEERAESLTKDTGLIDDIPEFDSMAALQVILAIEGHFGITVDSDDVTGDLFENISTLSRFVERHIRQGET